MKKTNTIQAKINGICYLLNPMDNTAEVTDGEERYVGAIEIPMQVTHNGVSYRVTSIGAEAFFFCRSLTAITIPNSVVTIGDLAFYYCTALSEITIPNSVETIKAGAFSFCEALRSITLPKHMKCIEYLAFYRCAMESIVIPDGVTELERVFVLCKELKSVTIPQSVQRMGAAYGGCFALTDVHFAGTIEQWHSIIFDNQCDNRFAATVVHCTDGDVKIEEAELAAKQKYVQEIEESSKWAAEAAKRMFVPEAAEWNHNLIIICNG